MAKKASTKGSKKPPTPARAAPPPRRGAAAAAGTGRVGAKVKYQQSGAPWWKQFLPG